MGPARGVIVVVIVGDGEGRLNLAYGFMWNVCGLKFWPTFNTLHWPVFSSVRFCSVCLGLVWSWFGLVLLRSVPFHSVCCVLCPVLPYPILWRPVWLLFSCASPHSLWGRPQGSWPTDPLAMSITTSRPAATITNMWRTEKQRERERARASERENKSTAMSTNGSSYNNSIKLISMGKQQTHSVGGAGQASDTRTQSRT